MDRGASWATYSPWVAKSQTWQQITLRSLHMDYLLITWKKILTIMVEKLNNILTEGSKHKKHVSDQAVWVMPDSGNNRASWGNGGVWFPMAGRKEIKDTGHPPGCHPHESRPHSLQMLIKLPKLWSQGKKKNSNSVIATTASHLIPTGQWFLGKLTAYNYMWNLHLHIFLWNRQTVTAIKRLTCIR